MVLLPFRSVGCNYCLAAVVLVGMVSLVRSDDKDLFSSVFELRRLHKVETEFSRYHSKVNNL